MSCHVFPSRVYSGGGSLGSPLGVSSGLLEASALGEGPNLTRSKGGVGFG